MKTIWRNFQFSQKISQSTPKVETYLEPSQTLSYMFDWVLNTSLLVFCPYIFSTRMLQEYWKKLLWRFLQLYFNSIFQNNWINKIKSEHRMVPFRLRNLQLISFRLVTNKVFVRKETSYKPCPTCWLATTTDMNLEATTIKLWSYQSYQNRTFLISRPRVLILSAANIWNRLYL